MGQFSVKIYTSPGSLLSANQQPSVKSLGKAKFARAYCARVVSVHIVDLRKFSQKPLNQ